MRNVVVVEGCQIPFQKAGSGYKNLLAYQLAKMAIRGLMEKTQLDSKLIDAAILGTVVQNVKTSNVAREAMLAAGLPHHIPAHTVTMACISANKAIAEAYNLIALDQADIIIAGGTDSVSDTPISFSKEMRTKLMDTQKLKSVGDYVRFATRIRPKDFMPEVPAIAEFTTGPHDGTRLRPPRRPLWHFAPRARRICPPLAPIGACGLRKRLVEK